jgi:hypothetical protein
MQRWLGPDHPKIEMSQIRENRGAAEHGRTVSSFRVGGTVSRCAYCGDETIGSGLCPHHNLGSGDDWARGNRIMCNFIHRGIVLPVADESVMPIAA